MKLTHSLLLLKLKILCKLFSVALRVVGFGHLVFGFVGFLRLQTIHALILIPIPTLSYNRNSTIQGGGSIVGEGAGVLFDKPTYLILQSSYQICL